MAGAAVIGDGDAYLLNAGPLGFAISSPSMLISSLFVSVRESVGDR